MTLEEFASLIPHNGAQMLDRLHRKQPPAGNVYSEEMLDERTREAAAWLRGYMHAMYDLGRITEKQASKIHSEISKWEV